MKVSELIKKLQAMPQGLEVYSYCDNGQTPEQANSPSIAYAGKISQTLWDDFSMIPSEADAEGYDKQFVLL